MLGYYYHYLSSLLVIVLLLLLVVVALNSSAADRRSVYPSDFGRRVDVSKDYVSLRLILRRSVFLTDRHLGGIICLTLLV